MTRIILGALAIALIASYWPDPVFAQESLATDPSEAVKGDQRRIMVMLPLSPDHYLPGADYGGNYGAAISERSRLRLARRLARRHHLTVVDRWPMERIGVDCVIMAIPDSRSVDQVVAELSSVDGIAWTQPLNEFRVQGGSAAHAHYNDRLYQAQPASSRWRLASLHRKATGRGVTIAIIDSQIDQRHPDLLGRISASPDFAPAPAPSAERHGTGVAGIVAAQPDNGLGIAGVAPDARILGLRACWERQRDGATVCDSLSLAKSLVYALDNQVDVINLSLTGPKDLLISTLINKAIEAGAIVIAAVDEANPDASFPATIGGVVPVADERLSAPGLPVYIAPGVDVPTTEPDGKWGLVSGSSYAAAHVSGLAALLRQLSGDHGTPSGEFLFGDPGPIDACAAISRLERSDAAPCADEN